ncbi:MAG: DUF2147 domain-containing protein [Hyphomicrobiaceae bacterium]|nr:DUF2147 domain-containing protein [Hyphomicrobiaceae bacterium]
MVSRWHVSTAFAAWLTLAVPGVANADRPEGVWLDHEGRGAVEIAPCGESLCGTVVWVRDAAQHNACGLQVLGGLRLVTSGVWDNGWILDPDAGEKFDAAITVRPDDTLEVVGYLGVKTLSETFEWRRAPTELALCASATTDSVQVSAAPLTPKARAPE